MPPKSTIIPSWLNYVVSPVLLIVAAYALIHTLSVMFMDGKTTAKRIGLLAASTTLVFISIAGVFQHLGLGLLNGHDKLAKYLAAAVAIAILGLIAVVKALVGDVENLGDALSQARNAARQSATGQVVRTIGAVGGAAVLAHLGFSLARSAPSLQSGAIFSKNLPVLHSELQSITPAPLAANPVGTYVMNNDAQGTARVLIVSPTDTGADRVQLATLNNHSVVVGAQTPAAAYLPMYQYDPRIARVISNPAALDAQSAEQGLLAVAGASLPTPMRQAAVNEAALLSKNVTSQNAE